MLTGCTASVLTQLPGAMLVRHALCTTSTAYREQLAPDPVYAGCWWSE